QSRANTPPLILGGGYAPAQPPQTLPRRDGTIEGGEHVVPDAEFQRPTARLDDAETGRPVLGKQADHGKDSIVAHCAHNNPDKLRDIYPTFTTLQPELAGKIVLSYTPEKSDFTQLKKIADLMDRLQMLPGKTQRPDVATPRQ